MTVETDDMTAETVSSGNRRRYDGGNGFRICLDGKEKWNKRHSTTFFNDRNLNSVTECSVTYGLIFQHRLYV